MFGKKRIQELEAENRELLCDYNKQRLEKRFLEKEIERLQSELEMAPENFRYLYEKQRIAKLFDYSTEFMNVKFNKEEGYIEYSDRRFNEYNFCVSDYDLNNTLMTILKEAHEKKQEKESILSYIERSCKPIETLSIRGSKWSEIIKFKNFSLIYDYNPPQHVISVKGVTVKKIKTISEFKEAYKFFENKEI